MGSSIQISPDCAAARALERPTTLTSIGRKVYKHSGCDLAALESHVCVQSRAPKARGEKYAYFDKYSLLCQGYLRGVGGGSSKLVDLSLRFSKLADLRPYDSSSPAWCAGRVVGGSAGGI